MTEHRLSIPGLLCVWMLSSHRLLDEGETLRDVLYDAFHGWLARSPDHVFNQAWELLNAKFNDKLNVIAAIDFLHKEVLIQRHQNWFIKPEALGAWQQGLVSRVSPLPIMAFVGAKSLPVQPHSQRVDDHLDQFGLNETHVHLNGSTFAEQAWLYALQFPQRSLADFIEEWWENKVRQRDLVRHIDPSLSPSVLYRRLNTARRLRQHLMQAAEDDALWKKDHCINTRDICTLSDRGSFTVEEELKWHTQFIRQCQKHPTHQVWADAYHRYLLLFNQYYQLTVQNEDRKGFDQFQKHADIGLREEIEADYTQRFKDAHGPIRRRSRVRHYEGRFAPKPDPSKLIRLIKKILGGYFKYLCSLLPSDHPWRQRRSPLDLRQLMLDLDELKGILTELDIHPLELTLICHFIKVRTYRKKIASRLPRNYEVSKKIHEQARALNGVMKIYPGLSKWIRGVDGAGNEFHAWPEPFAPVFRLCAEHGLSRKTFHAGEDFHHILSGLGYMLDAIELLDLQSGDRLGHGTAMGIDPKLWVARMPQEILIPRGEWFLGLLAAWRLCITNPAGHEDTVHTLATELAEVSVALFGKYLDPYLCCQALDMRRLNAREVRSWIDDGRPELLTYPIHAHRRSEREKVIEAATSHPEAFELYRTWQFDRDFIKKCSEVIQVKSEFLSPAAYLHLQQSLMKKVADLGVVIETLPSSNVRISQYKHFTEHHAMRWMKVPSVTPPGDPDILVTLGSDDPGIFATDIETEFHHLFFASMAHGLNEREALERVSAINENGRIYGFGLKDR